MITVQFLIFSINSSPIIPFYNRYLLIINLPKHLLTHINELRLGNILGQKKKIIKMLIVIGLIFLILPRNIPVYGYGSSFETAVYFSTWDFKNVFFPGSNISAYYYYNKSPVFHAQVTLIWNTSVNLDLYLYDINKTLIRNSSSINSNTEEIKFLQNYTGKYYILINRTSGIDDLFFNLSLLVYLPENWNLFDNFMQILILITIIALPILSISIIFIFKKMRNKRRTQIG